MAHKKLIGLRKKIGLSQEQLAEKVGMDQTTYSRKETGKSGITDEEWDRMADALGVDVDEIKSEETIHFNNENCTFHDSVLGIQYINVPHELLNTVLRFNQMLETENAELKQRLDKLEGK